MRYTLLMRLCGPMQAWGLQSRFSIRDTAREPTKSGVLGMVCAALGRDRTADVSDLATLRMGVRVDREGQLRQDFHTAQNVLKASAKWSQLQKGKGGPTKDTEPSTRHYLADAWFTVGLEGEDRTLLEGIDAALAAPYWPIFLGRKAFPAALPVHIRTAEGPVGLMAQPLVPALQSFADPWLEMTGRPRDFETEPRYVVEASADLHGLEPVARRMQPDQPLSYRPRRFLPREVIVGFTPSEEPHALPQQTPA